MGWRRQVGKGAGACFTCSSSTLACANDISETRLHLQNKVSTCAAASMRLTVRLASCSRGGEAALGMLLLRRHLVLQEGQQLICASASSSVSAAAVDELLAIGCNSSSSSFVGGQGYNGCGGLLHVRKQGLSRLKFGLDVGRAATIGRGGGGGRGDGRTNSCR